MIEGGGLPSGGGVAGLAGGSETTGDVIGVGGALEVRHVASRASGVRRRQVVIIVNVARNAGDGGVRTRQRKSGERMVKLGV